MSEESLDWWTAIRQTPFFTPPEPEPEPLKAEDVPLADWAAQRTELGLGRYDTGDFVGINGDQAGGLPDWRHPVHIEPEPTAMDEYAETRQASGVRSASDIFGVAPRQARVNSSPWSI